MKSLQLANHHILRETDSRILRAKPLILTPAAKLVHIVLDSGPLTIEQIKTSRGDIAYRLTTRSKKYAHISDLKAFRAAIQRELARVGAAKDRREYDRQKYLKNRIKRLKQMKVYYDTHKAEIAAKRRKK